MSDPLPDLERELAQLLESEKEVEPLPASQRARALSSVLARVGTSSADGVDARRAQPRTSGGRVGGLLAGHPLVAPLVTFALGVGVGVGSYATFAQPERIPHVSVPTTTAKSETPSRLSESVDIVAAESDGGASVRASPLRDRGRAVAEDGASSLAAERALLDVARHAVAAGDPILALDAVDRHARDFPNGILGEEREALAIKALALAHRSDEAQARAERFRLRYPNSLSLPAVERAAPVQ